MKDALILIMGILATWRLTYMLMKEEGPYDMLEKLRDKLGIRYDLKSNAYSESSIGRLFLCYYCLSIWCGFLIAVLQKRDPITYALFYSACTIILWEHRDG